MYIVSLNATVWNYVFWWIITWWCYHGELVSRGSKELNDISRIPKTWAKSYFSMLFEWKESRICTCVTCTTIWNLSKESLIDYDKYKEMIKLILVKVKPMLYYERKGYKKYRKLPSLLLVTQWFWND